MYHVTYETNDGKHENECFLEIPATGTKVVIPYYKFWFVTIMGEELEIERVIKPYKNMVKKINELQQRFANFMKTRLAEMKTPKGENSESTQETKETEKAGSEQSEASSTESSGETPPSVPAEQGKES